MNTQLRLTSGQLLQIIRLAKDNDNLDIDLLVRAMGLVEEETAETPKVEQAEPKAKTSKEEKEDTKLHKRWTEKEDQKLIYLYKNTSLPISQIGEQLGRNESSIHNRLRNLRESKRIDVYRTGQKGVAGKTWTKDEVFFLKEELNEHGEPKDIPKDNIELLAKLFDRTANAVVTKLYTIHKEEIK